MKIRSEIIAAIFFLSIQLTAGKEVVNPDILPGSISSWGWNIWHEISGNENPVGSKKTTAENRRNSFWSKMSDSLRNISAYLNDLQRSAADYIENSVKLTDNTAAELMLLSQRMGIIESIFDELAIRMKNHKTIISTENVCLFASDQLYTDQIATKIDEVIDLAVLNDPPLVDLILEDFKSSKSSTFCGKGHSEYETIFGLYSSILAVRMRAFVIELFSHNFLLKLDGTAIQCDYSENSIETNIEAVHGKLRQDLQKLNQEFIEKMKHVPRTFRTCFDRFNHTKGETYWELDGAIVSILQPIFSYTDELKGPNECAKIDTQSNGRLFCSPEWKMCIDHPGRGCRGRIFNCKDVQKPLSACSNANRLKGYSWLLAGGKNIDKNLENNKDCAAGQVITLTDVPRRCICDCNDNDVDSPTTHLINLRPVTSDTEDNMVITGIKFVVHYGILQFQIQQGKLGMNGQVTDVHWKPIDDISDEVRHVRLGREPYRGLRVFTENRDFLIIKKGTNNAINFDKLVLPHGLLLTGIKFTVRKDEGPLQRIGISLLGTRFDRSSGRFQQSCPMTDINSGITHTDKITYGGPKVTTESSDHSDKYIEIDATKYDGFTGIRTVPFFDAVPVESHPPSPLGGVELFHRMIDDHSGMVSLGLISLDYVRYMETSESNLISDEHFRMEHFYGKDSMDN
ncbi:uncharacterized protein LOC135171112 [Diachasmimorpha longicaudata]|uniref:uncharacterized protein LOC135171112 n=1 Tax=Diachasmimorpha longicaudata TaxID=58733 RepID=UPI0030B91A65